VSDFTVSTVIKQDQFTKLKNSVRVEVWIRNNEPYEKEFEEVG
jgi:hypothetical protein